MRFYFITGSTSECTTWRTRSDAVRSSWVVAAGVRSARTCRGQRAFAGALSWSTRASRRTRGERRRAPNRAATREARRKPLAKELSRRALKHRYNVWRLLGMDFDFHSIYLRYLWYQTNIFELPIFHITNPLEFSTRTLILILINNGINSGSAYNIRPYSRNYRKSKTYDIGYSG